MFFVTLMTFDSVCWIPLVSKLVSSKFFLWQRHSKDESNASKLLFHESLQVLLKLKASSTYMRSKNKVRLRCIYACYNRTLNTCIVRSYVPLIFIVNVMPRTCHIVQLKRWTVDFKSNALCRTFSSILHYDISTFFIANKYVSNARSNILVGFSYAWITIMLFVNRQ